ncbi:MAG: KdsC family phosphatase [Candidatus Polarisedimenticolia bacterium]
MTSLAQRIAPITLVLLDVDGVLTDGGIIYEGADTELKRFHIQDGMGVTLAVKAGLKVGILTGRTSPMVERRGRELSMAVIKQGFHDKLEGWNEILREQRIEPREIAYIGDDVQDLPVLWRAGFSAAPADAVPEVRSQVHYVCERPGGHGAVREIIDLVLEHKGLKSQVIEAFTGARP